MSNNNLYYYFVVLLLPIIVMFIYQAIKKAIDESIKNRFDLLKEKEIEKLRADFNTVLEAAKHQYQIDQLRTSYFLDHQKNIFSEILHELTHVSNDIEKSYDFEESTFRWPPKDLYERTNKVFLQGILFLNKRILLIKDLFLRTLITIQPKEEPGGRTHMPDNKTVIFALNEQLYLIESLAELFQSMIGLTAKKDVFRDLAIYGTIILINEFHFASHFPTKGRFKKTNFDSVRALILEGKEHLSELTGELDKFLTVLKSKENQVFYEEYLTGEIFYTELKKNNNEISKGI